MASVEHLISKPLWSVVTTKNDNSIATAVKAAPGAGFCHYITAAHISYSAAPSAVVSATLADATGTLAQWELAAASAAPIILSFGDHALKCRANEAATLTLPALGGTTKGTIVLFGFTSTV